MKHLTGLILLFITACGICSQGNCVDELTVELQGKLPETYTVELTNGESKKIANCPLRNDELSGGFCLENKVVFHDIFENEVTVKLTRNGQDVIQSFKPEFQPIQPTGSDCGTCKKGKITFTFS